MIASTSEIVKVAADGKPTVLLRGTALKLAAPHHLTPLGYRPDGTLMIAADDTVWALRDGRLTRFYTARATPAGPPGPITNGAVDATGATYIETLPPTPNDADHLGGITEISATGTVTPIRIPASFPGDADPLIGWYVWGMTSDGAAGVYVIANDGASHYSAILHIHRGTVTVLAGYGRETAPSCVFGGQVDLASLPCIPTETDSIGYARHRIIIIGDDWTGSQAFNLLIGT